MNVRIVYRLTKLRVLTSITNRTRVSVWIFGLIYYLLAAVILITRLSLISYLLNFKKGRNLAPLGLISHPSLQVTSSFLDTTILGQASMGIAMHLYLILLSLLLSLETQAAQSIFKSFSKTIKNILHIPEDPSLPSAWDFNDLSFSGITYAFLGLLWPRTFARLPHVKCLVHPEESFDIAILGCPFDTATSHRPGIS